MSNKAIVEVTGFKELQQKIKQLSNPKDKKREVLRILRQAAKPTLRAARNYAPVSKKSHVARGKRIPSGTLKKSIGNITGKRGLAKENPTIYVGPRTRGRYDGWYGHFVEAGVNVYRKGFKRKHTRGANAKAAVRRTKGQYFMKRAYITTGGRVIKEAEKTTARFIQRRIDKLSR